MLMKTKQKKRQERASFFFTYTQTRALKKNGQIWMAINLGSSEQAAGNIHNMPSIGLPKKKARVDKKKLATEQIERQQKYEEIQVCRNE